MQPYEILTGEFGIHPSFVGTDVIYFEKEEDFYGLFISELDHDRKQVDQSKFSNPYIYEFEGYFYNNQDPCHQKSIYTLFEYIDKHLIEGLFIEIYSCRDEKKRKSGTNIPI